MTVRELVELCADAYSVPVEDVLLRSHAVDANHARNLAYFMLVKHGNLARAAVGRYFGRHHSTITHGVDCARAQLATRDGRLAYEYVLRQISKEGERESRVGPEQVMVQSRQDHTQRRAHDYGRNITGTRRQP